MKHWHAIRVAVGTALLVAPLQFASIPASAAGKTMTILHYFSGKVGHEGIAAYYREFKKETGITVVDSPIGQEDFKTDILVRAAGNNLPDVFSYWAGARTQFLADAGKLAPIDDLWNKNNFSSIIVKSVADAATKYNGIRYLVPIGYDYAGIFYNPKVMKDAGITTMPKTWNDLVSACKTLRAKGYDPIALGSKNRWPAQFWFDYLVLRTAGPEYRARLMNGKASYTDPQVKKVMEMWKTLIDDQCFAPNANAYTWTEAADQVARGDAAMTLMGSWIGGYWNDAKLKPVEDYDVFPFPIVNPDMPVAAVGPVNGIVMSKNAAHPDAARAFLKLVATNVPLQNNWAKVEGALSPNVNVDTSVYTPVQKKAFDLVKSAATYAFNYDLATPPPVAEVGLNMFAKFMSDSSNIDGLLAETQKGAAEAFKKK